MGYSTWSIVNARLTGGPILSKPKKKQQKETLFLAIRQRGTLLFDWGSLSEPSQRLPDRWKQNKKQKQIKNTRRNTKPKSQWGPPFASSTQINRFQEVVAARLPRRGAGLQSVHLSIDAMWRIIATGSDSFLSRSLSLSLDSTFTIVCRAL